MKFVVTGALGHIGSQLIRKLAEYYPGSEILLIDSMMTQRYCSLFNLPSGAKYRFIDSDLMKLDLPNLLKGADVVVQLAAITDAANSFQNKEAVEQNNFNTTAKLGEACIVTGSKLIHLSSTSVYGTADESVDEFCSDEQLKPQSPYAETKLKEEKFLVELAGRGLKHVTFRFGTICGVSPGMRFHTAVNKFCWQSVMGIPITVWKTALHQKRPYLDLTDATRAVQFVIDRDLFSGLVYNVVTSNHTVQEILDMIKLRIARFDVEFVDAAIMNQLSYDVMNTRFKEAGFTFSGSIDHAVESTIQLLKGAATA
ncbi:MAG: SDR family oxidoreductase [Leptospirales bacterium]|nr:SDR family oxidoreductase [Leptospirales bacterium]